jgi:DNA-binding NarL/FixJ family response regulator
LLDGVHLLGTLSFFHRGVQRFWTTAGVLCDEVFSHRQAVKPPGTNRRLVRSRAQTCVAIQSSPDFLMGDSLIYFLRVTIPKGVGGRGVCASQAVAELKIPFRILIADDNALVRTAMREVLEEVDEQWEIVEAADGRDAVRKAQQLKPELVILDLVMPVSGGLTASRQISKLLPRVPILLHTLYWSEEIELEAAKAGVRKVVRKSETRALISAVQDVLGSAPESASAVSKPEASVTTETTTETATRRREGRIRELCDRLFSSKEDDAQASLFRELRAALHEHIENVRAKLVYYPGV